MTAAEWHEWTRRVLGSDMTNAQKLVLVALQTFADYPAGTNARPGVDLLAVMCRFGTRVVDAALHQGRELGFIEQTARANPKRRLAVTYKLVSARTGERVDDSSARTGERVEDVSTRTPMQFQPARNDVSTRTPVRTTDSEHRLKEPEGGSPQVSTSLGEPHPLDNAPPKQSANGQTPTIEWLDVLPPIHWPAEFDEPEPARFCERHPGGTPGRCGACGDVRKAHEAWAAQRDRWRHDRHAACEAYTAHCDLCDDAGWLLGPDGSPLDDPAVHCMHAHCWEAHWRRRGVLEAVA